MFWADQIAQDLIETRDQFVVMTGITPSGHIHVGNMREVVTADAVVKALQEKGKDVRFYYIADTFDPLRKVYPFLDEAMYAEHVGKPLSEIPAPDGSDQSYADYFLSPFLDALKQLDIQVEVKRADQLYKDGLYTQNIIKALEKTKAIRDILKQVTRKDTDDDWSPFVPICEKTGKMTGNKVLGFDADKQTVQYVNEDGYESEVSMAGGGKLTWRVDWPARWEILGVTFEPFGKDHATRGGSHDTAKRLVQEVFDYPVPHPAVYEWISLKGGGDMSSSKGNVLSIAEMVDVMPAEVLKYSVARAKPTKAITFDPGLPMLTLIDEFDDPQAKNRVARAAQLSKVSDLPPLGIPFNHIVSLTQTTLGDIDRMEEILLRAGYDKPNRDILTSRVHFAKKWLNRFAPEDMKFSLQETMPAEVANLTTAQKQALGMIGEKISDDFSASDIHNLIYEAKDKFDLTPKTLFEAIYVSLLGKNKGPRAGFFLASLETDFVKTRFSQSASA
jgi:lysyl-tRNA synthetase class 1